jgi:uncharacterized membrane protein YccC
VSASTSFWRTVTRVEVSKIAPVQALRNAVAIALPLAAGVALGNTAAGLVACIGALNVAASDGSDPYRFRARRMCTASLLVALAVFGGGLFARQAMIVVALVAICGFVAGLMVAVGTTAADIGSIALVTLIVFSTRPMSAVAAIQSGAIALAGGLLQTAFALALWPLHRYQPERRSLSAFFAELGRAAAAPPQIHEAPPASDQSTQAQTALAGLSGDRSLEAERCLALLSQAERIRLALMMLSRLRVRIGREPGGDSAAQVVEHCLTLAGTVLSAIATSLSGGAALHPHAQLEQLRTLAESLREAGGSNHPGLAELLRDARLQAEALAGQLRSAEELADHIAPDGTAAFAQKEAAQPPMLRLTGALALLRANLSLDSAAMRHALRLAVCVAVGETVSAAAGWTRAYWCPMTIAIVLKPDFTGTFSRGILRVAGTLIGLAFATALFHVLSPSMAVQVVLIGIFAFLLRCFGPANYGIFVMVLTALVVLLIAMTGVTPGVVIAARGLNTVAGGVIALTAYALWPTWERTRVPEELAGMFDAYRVYFETVRDAYTQPNISQAEPLDRARLAARRARSNLEASVARFRSEPGARFDRVTSLDAILANSHRFIHAVMSLEAGLARSRPVPARQAFYPFAADTVRTLSLLSAALHGAPTSLADFPNLREDHNALVRSPDPQTARYALVNLESDRITNSLNTLTLEVLQWIAA